MSLVGRVNQLTYGGGKGEEKTYFSPKPFIVTLLKKPSKYEVFEHKTYV